MADDRKQTKYFIWMAVRTLKRTPIRINFLLCMRSISPWLFPGFVYCQNLNIFLLFEVTEVSHQKELGNFYSYAR